MPVFTINPVNITANVEKDSPSTTLAANINSATIQLTDSAGSTTPTGNSNWLKTTGNILEWGLQNSTDGGTTWNWFVYSPNPIPFGGLDKGGNMPMVGISGSQFQAVQGEQLRLAILTDTTIKLGAIITVN